MMIRKADPDDAVMMKDLHDRAVLELCKDDYTNDQLLHWVNRSPLEKYYWRIETQRIFIAELDALMLGYVRWYPQTNELCSICVEPEFARQGIASKPMAYVCKDAREQRVLEVWLDASIPAVPFYEALGWEHRCLSTSGSLDSVRMKRQLHPENT